MKILKMLNIYIYLYKTIQYLKNSLLKVSTIQDFLLEEDKWYTNQNIFIKIVVYSLTNI